MNPTHANTPRDHAEEVLVTSDLLKPIAPGDDEPALALLKAGIPLSLLMDLAGGELPSKEMYEVEGVETDAFANLQ